MADIKSAAGEGPEPQVPGRDQPAQELANLIAQSEAGAKGKGFWRRRRRKNTTPDPAPPAPAAEEKKPAPEPAKPAEPATEPAKAAEPAASAPTDATEAAPAESKTAGTATVDSTEAAESTGTTEAATAGPTEAGSPATAESAAAAAGATSGSAGAAEAAADGSAGAAAETGETARDAGAASGSAGDAEAAAHGSAEAAEATTAETVEDEGRASDGAPEPASGADVKADGAGAEASVAPADAADEDGADLAAGDSSAKAAEVSSTEGAESKDESSAAGAESADGGSGDEAASADPEDAAAEVGGKAGDASTEVEAEDAAESMPDAESAGNAGADVAAKTDSAGQDVAANADGAAAAKAGGVGEGVAVEVERPRPTVGVVYEPDESPDGFPLEYGNIIVGLPKQADGSSIEIDEARAYAEELAAVQSAGLDARLEEEVEEPTEQAAGEEPGDHVAEAASEESAEEPEVEQSSDDAETTEAEQPSEDAGTTEAEQPSDEAETADVPADVVAEEPVESGSDDESADGVVEPVVEETAAEESAEATAVAEEAVEGDSGDEDAETAAEGPAEDVAGGGAETEQDSAEELAEESAADAEPVEVELTAEELAERLAAEQAAMALITSLMKLRGALAGSRLPLDVVGADEARQQQKAMLDQLDDYILPRLVQLEAPILAVVGGSTGAGKSTLVNSVIGKVVSEPGVLRPTTRSPVLIHHPADADWFIGDRVLPGMARTTAESLGGMEDPGQLRLVASDTVPRGLAVLDAPDIDSVVEANRDLATQLLAAADLWLFVTTAARYSDAVPWEFLQSASDRSTAVAVVLDRAPAETIDDITGHLAQMLLERGLGDSPLFSIRETVVDGNGMLPGETVASIKDWLVDLAADAEARAAVVRRTLHGAVTSMVKTTPPFAAAVRAQGDTAVELRSSAEAAYDQAVKDIATSTQDATLLRGEVLARWQEFVGTGELLKGLQANSGKLREKVKKSLANAPAPTRDLNDAIESGLSSLLVEQAEAAAERAEKIWQATPAGRQLLAVAGTAADAEIVLGAMSPEFQAKAERAVREWQAGVLDLVREVGTEKRLAARILDAGVNGLSLSVMVVLFAENAGIPTGAEASIGVGSAVVGQKLLTAVFGDAAVQTLMSKARADLDGKVHALMDAEFARYLAVLDQHPVDPEAARQLTEAARAVEDCT
ncbi:AAA family ATPase [Kribbella sp. NPDC056345]|uniref:AAA family ATPase n=1 Tax=Kribbella sp. NPDC056345 TaxID=3345789 RepID=UPI0035DD72E1